MKKVYADAQYFVALINDKDQSHSAALAASQALHGVTVVTTEETLIEVLAFFAERGDYLRSVAVAYVDDILADPDVIIRLQSHQSFLDGYALYKARPDKGYSLTDCILMDAMRRDGVTDILTDDDHFAQEGFAKLLWRIAFDCEARSGADTRNAGRCALLPGPGRRGPEIVRRFTRSGAGTGRLRRSAGHQ